MKLGTVLKVVVGLALIAPAFWFVPRHLDDLKKLRHLELGYIPALVGVHLGAMTLNGWINRKLIARLGVKLPWTHWFGLAAINALANYLPLPQAGALTRGMYLKKLHGLGYRRYAASVLYTYVMRVVLIGVVGLGVLAQAAWMRGGTSWMLWVLFGGLASSAVLLWPRVARLLPGERLKPLAEGYREFGSWRLLAGLWGLNVVLVAVNGTGLWLAYQSIGQAVAWLDALLVTLATMVSGVINVTPGNVGAAEGAAYVSAQLFGLDGGRAVVAYLVYRATSALVIFVVGPIFVALLGQAVARGAGEGEAVETEPSSEASSERS